MTKEIKKWTTLSSEYLIRRPWLTARRDRAMLPDGRIHPEYYVLEYPDWVNVIALTADGMMVMVRQYRYALQIVSTELCAGVIEKGESPLQAGYTGGEWRQLMTIGQNPSTCNNLTHCFVATGVQPTGTQHLDATEDVQMLLMKPDDVLGMLVHDEMKQALMAAPLWRYFAEHHMV